MRFDGSDHILEDSGWLKVPTFRPRKTKKGWTNFFSKKLGKKFGLIENFRNFLIELEIIFNENFIFWANEIIDIF